MKAFYWISAFFYLIAVAAFGLLKFQVALPIAVDLQLVGQNLLGIASLFLLIASIGTMIANKRDG